MNSLSVIGYPLNDHLHSMTKGEDLSERYCKLERSSESPNLREKNNILVWDKRFNKTRKLVAFPQHSGESNDHHLLQQLSDIRIAEFANIYDQIKLSEDNYLVTDYLPGYRPFQEIFVTSNHKRSLALSILSCYAKILDELHQSKRLAVGFLNPEGILIGKTKNRQHHILFSAEAFIEQPPSPLHYTDPTLEKSSLQAIPQNDIYIFGLLARNLLDPSYDFSRIISAQETSKSINHRWQNIIHDCTEENHLDRPSSIGSIIERSFGRENFSSATLDQDSGNSDELDKINKEREKALSKIENLERQLTIYDETVSESESKLGDLETQIESLESELQKARAEGEEAKSDYLSILNQGESGYEERMINLQDRVDQLKEELAETSNQKLIVEKKYSLVESERNELRQTQNAHDEKSDNLKSELDQIKKDNETLQSEVSDWRKKDKPASTPLLIALLAACLVGAVSGIFWSKLNSNKNNLTYQLDQAAITGSKIPDKIGTVSQPVRNALFLEYAKSVNIRPDHYEKLLPGLSEANSEQTASGVSYWLSVNLTNWLTQTQLSNEQIKEGFFYRLPKNIELTQLTGEHKISEWTSEVQLDDSNSEIGRKISPHSDTLKWLPPSMSHDFANNPMGFRVVLDKIKP